MKINMQRYFESMKLYKMIEWKGVNSFLVEIWNKKVETPNYNNQPVEVQLELFKHFVEMSKILANQLFEDEE